MNPYNREGHKNWTTGEINYLEEKWGSVSIVQMSKTLNRSVNAIKIKAQKLQLGAFLESGNYVTFNQLLQAVTGSENSYSCKTTSWIRNRDFPAKTKRVNNCTFQIVYLEDFWKWAEKNRSFIDFSKFEPFSLGKEPQWVAKQRKADQQNHTLIKTTPWTTLEDNKLLSLLKMQKYTYSELSKILCRSSGAIQRRCCELQTKYRPIKADNHSEDSKWTDADFAILAESIKSGDSYSVIALKLNKSDKAIRGKVYFVYFTESLDKVRAMLKGGNWGDGAPVPTVKQAKNQSNYRTAIKKDLSLFAGFLKIRMNQLGYDPYWQRFTCMNWDDLNGCAAGCDNCDECTEFIRIKPQYCSRCGKTFYERKSNDFCNDCRSQRKKQAQKKWAVLNNRKY